MEAVNAAVSPCADDWPWKWDRSLSNFIPKSTKFKDITGQKFGKLTAIYPMRTNSTRRVWWVCSCDCGTLNHKVLTDNLTRGQVQSCGCVMYTIGKEHFNADWVGNLSKGHLCFIRKSAEVRGLQFQVSYEYLSKLFEEQNRTCVLSGLPLVSGNKAKLRTASLDRIDSSIGYIEGNVQWLHKAVNRMKNAYPEEYFVRMCLRVSMHSISTNPLYEGLII